MKQQSQAQIEQPLPWGIKAVLFFIPITVLYLFYNIIKGSSFTALGITFSGITSTAFALADIAFLILLFALVYERAHLAKYFLLADAVLPLIDRIITYVRVILIPKSGSYVSFGDLLFSIAIIESLLLLLYVGWNWKTLGEWKVEKKCDISFAVFYCIARVLLYLVLFIMTRLVV